MKFYNYFHKLNGYLSIALIAVLFCSNSIWATEVSKHIGIFYYKNIFGHIHLNPTKDSVSLTTIACGHPLNVTDTFKSSGVDWFIVNIDKKKGYVLKEFVSNQKPLCFQEKYPKFFNSLNLDLTELYYWGRLYDQYVRGKSRVQ